ncbi:zinc-ribbon domain-containing protein [Saccharothrix sp. ST-888]|uniref:zinc-ribbon domain-containing protein n=1 Tax=Saccharothrix sp. ST-888 TaxID=1427391 RepID=UPI0009E54ABE
MPVSTRWPRTAWFNLIVTSSNDAARNTAGHIAAAITHQVVRLAAPQVAGEWHPVRNGELTPDSVAAGSSRKAWWLGPCGHEWQAVVHSRSGGCGCPYCGSRRVGYGNDLATQFPNVARDWHPTRNGDAQPDRTAPKSNRKVKFHPALGHSPSTPRGCDPAGAAGGSRVA